MGVLLGIGALGSLRWVRVVSLNGLDRAMVGVLLVPPQPPASPPARGHLHILKDKLLAWRVRSSGSRISVDFWVFSRICTGDFLSVLGGESRWVSRSAKVRLSIEA
eukprot:1385244-Amorphochlora_amoeboformis.AAC.1